jgi:hypothetical protein
LVTVVSVYGVVGFVDPKFAKLVNVPQVEPVRGAEARWI